MSQPCEEVGIVRALTRFPVKSMSGQDIEEAQISCNGLDGDRRFALLNPETQSDFPWVTSRDYPPLVRYQPYFVDAANVEESAVRVRTPGGHDLPIDSPELLDELRREIGKPFQLIQLSSGAFDALDVSLLSIESIKSLEAIVGKNLGRRRFRANITIETTPYVTHEFPEDTFVGGLLTFGDGDNPATVRIKRKDVRCMMVNIDPESARQEPAVLKAIVGQREGQFGVYGTTERPGRIKVGDVIRLVKE